MASEPERHTPSQANPITRSLFAALWLTLFVVAFNLSVMLVMIVPITRALGANVGSVQNAYVFITLVTAIFVPTSQQLGNMFGYKRVFMAGLLIFTFGMIISALSVNVATLILGFGLIAGVGATFMVTLPWTEAYQRPEGRRINRDILLFVLSTGPTTGSLAGSLVGGLMQTSEMWRWSFTPQIAIVLIILALIGRMEEPKRANAYQVDITGGLLSFFGVASILLGINLANEYGWWLATKRLQFADWIVPTSPLSVAPILIGVGALFLIALTFLRRTKTPRQSRLSIWQFDLFRGRLFPVSLAVGAVYSIGTAGLTFTIFLFLQTTLQLSPFETALAVAPYFGSTLAALILTYIVSRHQNLPPALTIRLGLLALIIGTWLLAATIQPGLQPADLAFYLALMGIGSGLVIGHLAELALSRAEMDLKGNSNGMFNTAQDLGNSLGISIFGVFLIYLLSVSVADGLISELDAQISDTERLEIIADFEDMLQTFSKEELDKAIAELPQNVQQALEKISLKTQFWAMQQTLRAIAAMLFAALAISLFLPRSGTRPKSDTRSLKA